MKKYYFIFCFIAGISTCVVARAVDLPAPFNATKGKHDQITVNFGESDPSSKNAEYESMTLLGSKGAEVIKLIKYEKKCEYLCEEPDPERPRSENAKPTCHFVGHYTRAKGNPAGEPLSAMSGAVKIQKYSPKKSDGEKPAKYEPWLSMIQSAEFSQQKTAVRWEKDYSGKVLLKRRSGKTIADLTNCRQSIVDHLFLIKCTQNVELIYADKKLIFLSFEENGGTAIAVVSAFEVSGQEYYLTRLPIYSKLVYGLIFKHDGKWQVTYWTPDYASQC